MSMSDPYLGQGVIVGSGNNQRRAAKKRVIKTRQNSDEPMMMESKQVAVAMSKNTAKACYAQYVANGGDLTYADWLNTVQTSATLPSSVKQRSRKRKRKLLKRKYAKFVYADGSTDEAEVEEDLDSDDSLMDKIKQFSDMQIAGFGLGALVVGGLIGALTYHLVKGK